MLPGTDEHSDADAYGGQIVVLCKEQLCPFITAPSFVHLEQAATTSQATALCFQLWPVWPLGLASLIQASRPLPGSI